MVAAPSAAAGRPRRRRAARRRLHAAGLRAAHRAARAGAPRPAPAPALAALPGGRREELVGRGAPGHDATSARPSPCPQDWAPAARDATGRQTFEIALLRARSTKQRDRIGSLLVNPGGPGGSGVDTAVYLSFGQPFGGLPDEITERFDIVGFDPRGVARSSPVKCISDADLDASFGYDPTRRARRRSTASSALNQRIGDGCGDQVRRPAARCSPPSRRPGTWTRSAPPSATRSSPTSATPTAPCSARRTPSCSRSNVRALVLDGAVDPQQELGRRLGEPGQGLRAGLHNFTALVRGERRPAARSPPDAARRGHRGHGQGRRSHPVRGADGREATAGWVFYAVISSLYTESGWQELAQAIDDLADGDPRASSGSPTRTPTATTTGTTRNLFDANLAINCADDDGAAELERRSAQLQSRVAHEVPAVRRRRWRSAC